MEGLVTDRCHGNVAYYCNGKDPGCNKRYCYVLGGECCRTTNPKYRLTPLIVDGIEIKTRIEPFGEKYVEVFDNDLKINSKTKYLNEVPNV